MPPRSGGTKEDIGIAGAETDGLLMEQDRLLRRAGEQLAPPNMGVCVHEVAIERKHGFVFGNRFVEAVLCTEHLAFGEMRLRVIRGLRQGSSYQLLCAFDVRST